jgi:uncharacterized protein (DUF1499 family)
MIILPYTKLLVLVFVPIILACSIVTSLAYSSHKNGHSHQTMKDNNPTNTISRQLQVKGIEIAAFSRRSLVATVIGISMFGVGTATAAVIAATENQGAGSLAISDLKPCKSNSRNCVHARWIAPPGTSKSAAEKDLRDVLQLYPQVGQSNVDCNGWNIATDNLAEDGGMKVEYKSCIGPAAMSINLGRPFVDDVQLKILDLPVLDGSASSNVIVDVKSKSRMGSSDYGVNKKRINWLANELHARGWDTPRASYVPDGEYDAYKTCRKLPRTMMIKPYKKIK